MRNKSNYEIEMIRQAINVLAFEIGNEPLEIALALFDIPDVFISNEDADALIKEIRDQQT